ncbi:MAG: TrkA family potassium uptake protein [Anaerotignum sp.]|nr:TrkA family potassium uptake protein [Anaerotignum sp.]
MKSFLIIGMGSFGHHLCRSLAKQRCEIMIVDEKQENLEDMLRYVTSAKIGDCTNPDVMQSFDVASFDACFVSVGNSFQNSLQITNLLKEQGAKKVYSKADEDIQAKFLLRNGADEVIYPEKEGAERIAIRASSDNIFDCIELSDDFYIMEIQSRPEWLGKTISELNFRKKYHLNIMATKQAEKLFPMPDLEYRFCLEEHLMVMGHIEDIRKVTK